MPQEPDGVDVERKKFPWASAALVLVLLWVSLWVAGVAGSMAGFRVYEDKYISAPPYTAQQLETLERVSPDAFAIAKMDAGSWQSAVDLERAIARLEGRVVGGLLWLGIWASTGVMWLWNRQRERHAQLLFLADFS